jgi:hypothetical protein
MIKKWFREYKKLSFEIRFISQLAAFLISLFTVLSLYDWIQLYFVYPKWFNELNEVSELFLVSIILQISIATIFAARFVLLFFNTEKAFCFNQTLYLIGLSTLFFYWYLSRPPKTSFAMYSTYIEIFRYASRSFDFFAMWYLLLSPIRQLVTLITSLINVGNKRW